MEVVRHCFQTEYSQYPRGVSLPGLGDFLRGSCALVPICQRLNLQLTLYFWNHRVGDYLESDEPDRHILRDIGGAGLRETPTRSWLISAGNRNLMTNVWPDGSRRATWRPTWTRRRKRPCGNCCGQRTNCGVSLTG